MKLFVKMCICVIFLFLSNINYYAQGTYDLAYKFEKGKPLVYKLNVIANLKFTIMGQDNSMGSDVTLRHQIEAMDILPDKFTLSLVDDSISAKMNMPEGGGYTEEKGDTSKMRMQIRCDKYGKILDTLNLSSTNLFPDFVLNRNNIQQIEFARKAVRIGEEWSTSSTDSIPFVDGNNIGYKYKVHYKIAGIESYKGIECLKIISYGEISFDGTINADSESALMVGKGIQKGTAYFDYVNGVLLSTNIEITGNIDVNSITDTEQSVTMSIEVKDTSVLQK